MYVIEFVNLVRQAQGYESIDALPPAGDSGASPLELAMGCRLEPGLMRLSSPRAAHQVALATGQPVGFDGFTIALPAALCEHAAELERIRAGERRPGDDAQAGAAQAV